MDLIEFREDGGAGSAASHTKMRSIHIKTNITLNLYELIICMERRPDSQRQLHCDLCWQLQNMKED